MSARPGKASAPPAKRPRVTTSKLAEKKTLGEPIAMVTAYDYPSAQVAEEAGVDVVLVGDSGAMTVLGYPSTVPVSIDEMLMLASAVRRGLTTPFLVGDMPFGSYEESNELAIRSAQRDHRRSRADRGRRAPGRRSKDRLRCRSRALRAWGRSARSRRSESPRRRSRSSPPPEARARPRTPRARARRSVPASGSPRGPSRSGA